MDLDGLESEERVSIPAPERHGTRRKVTPETSIKNWGFWRWNLHTNVDTQISGGIGIGNGRWNQTRAFLITFPCFLVGSDLISVCKRGSLSLVYDDVAHNLGGLWQFIVSHAFFSSRHTKALHLDRWIIYTLPMLAKCCHVAIWCLKVLLYLCPCSCQL